MQRDHARFTASRIAAFEEMLEDYLARDRGFATSQRAANALALSSRELLAALLSRREQAVISRERGINALRARINGLMALRKRAQSLCEQVEHNAEALANSLKAAGPELTEQLRVRAVQAADTVMDTDWTAKPPAEREALVNKAVHRAAL